jgi:GDP-L-fucose synthase
MKMNQNSKIYVAGHGGMVGSALIRKLKQKGYQNLLTRTSKQLDLTVQRDVLDFFAKEKPDIVYLAAAKVGGIHANNTFRAEFLYDNLMIQTNIIHASHIYGVKKLLFLGSSCIYPKLAKQPLQERSLLTSELEATNEPYAIAKIAGIKMCENYYRQYGDEFISVMPTNLYGPNDNYDLETSHVFPALIRKFSSAKVKKLKEVTIWGSGNPQREFLHVDDMAEACIYVMENVSANQLYQSLQISHLNIGSGEEITIKALAELIKYYSGFTGELRFDTTKPDGTPRKLLDSSTLLSLGWLPHISLDDGIQMSLNDFNLKYLTS